MPRYIVAVLATPPSERAPLAESEALTAAAMLGDHLAQIHVVEFPMGNPVRLLGAAVHTGPHGVRLEITCQAFRPCLAADAIVTAVGLLSRRHSATTAWHVRLVGVTAEDDAST
ncbi:hypothetical protein LG943_12690 [Streptomonospora sp. S1-112]|uniref:Uncharacterized protein n=1 Tax=Streptomonospora mangrovi TaxID=2883123 RepID=A0A9X3SNG3_9ACTN|nr:hypothetical protein [Streptomonospora mangrovi]MDA0565166.1 hypothetical protein [Streptomonospora mangrovi]